MYKTKIFSVTAKDCRWDYYRGSGNGGQKRNKTSNCCRCTHEASGAVGKSEDGRSQSNNRKIAFKRMAETDTFQTWVRIEVARRTGELREIENRIERETKDPSCVKIEIRKNNKWHALENIFK